MYRIDPVTTTERQVLADIQQLWRDREAGDGTSVDEINRRYDLRTRRLDRIAEEARGTRLPRLSNHAAMTLHAYHRQQIPAPIVSTHCLLAYEAMAGIIIDPHPAPDPQIDLVTTTRDGLRPTFVAIVIDHNGWPVPMRVMDPRDYASMCQDAAVRDVLTTIINHIGLHDLRDHLVGMEERIMTKLLDGQDRILALLGEITKAVVERERIRSTSWRPDGD